MYSILYMPWWTGLFEPFTATRENIQSDEEDIETDEIDSNLPDDDGLKQDNDDGGGVPDVSVLYYLA